MSKIERFQGNVRAFASDAQGMERTVFGGTNQADDLTSQITASFLRGWGIVGASEHPSLEDFNAAMYAMSQFIAYQHQMGVPEWHAEQEYHIGSICTHNGESYQSLQNANIGSQPPSAKWTPVLTSKNGLENLGLGSGLTGVVGAAINARMSVTAPSATATFTADELIVETGTGTQYRLNAFSQEINLGTVGAGGMDTGTAPASGYLAIYALFNPTTGDRCLIGVNATAAKVPEIYGGAYMPAGYTASALISVVATNASSLILPFSQIARTITIGSLSVFNTTTASASLVTVNIASAVPKNAKSVKLTGNTSTSGSSALFLNIYETSNAMGQNAFATTSTGLTYTTGYINLPVPQTIYANYGPAVTGFNQALLVSGYTF